MRQRCPSMRSFADHLDAPTGQGALAGLARTPAPPAAPPAATSCASRCASRATASPRPASTPSGCGAARAAGSAVVELVEGEPFLDAARVDAGRRRGRARRPDARQAPRRRRSPPTRSTARSAPPPRTAPRGSRASARRTLVAMSGGVDSAAAAQLALDAGDEVVAVTLELWSDPATDGERAAARRRRSRGARALAHRMGIPHVTLDLRERFRAEVVDDFLDGYAAGRTPNPCVRCNGEVRFDAMLELAERARRRAARHRPLRAHRARRARPAHPRRRATRARTRATCSPSSTRELLERLCVPARRPHQGRRARARARGRPAGGRQAREPGPLLRRRPRRPRLPAPPRRPAPAPAGRDRRRATAACSAATRASTTSRSASGAASASAAAEPLYVLARTPRRNRVVVGPQDGARDARACGSRTPRLHRAPRRCRARPAALPRRAARVPRARPATDGSLELELDRARRRRRTRAAGLPDAR